MSEHPFFWDIVIIIVAMPLLEAAILRQNYRILSPVTIFCIAIFYLYALPYISHFYFAPNRLMNRLSYEQFSLAFKILRYFLYTYCLVAILLLVRLSKRDSKVMVLDPAQVNKLSIILLLLFIPVLILKLGIGVGFSPAAMLDRAFNPRAYTYIRVSLGPLFHIHIGFTFVLLALESARVFTSNKSLGSIAFFLLCSFVSIIGGDKRSFVAPLIIFAIIWQKMSWQQKSVFQKLRKTLLVCAILGFVILLSFALWFSPGEVSNLGYAASLVVQYQREAYYLPLVIEVFPWSPHVLPETLLDTIISPIPRAIWANKPLFGLWNRHFRPTFEPKTVYYHTSTFGCLSEAHMLFGRFGPFIYGIVWALVSYKLYVYMISHDSLYKASVVGIMVFWTYMLARTGFLGINLPTLLVYFAIAWIATRNTKVVYYEEMQLEEYPVSESIQESYQD